MIYEHQIGLALFCLAIASTGYAALQIGISIGIMRNKKSMKDKFRATESNIEYWGLEK